MKLTETLIRKLLSTVDRGLSCGLGYPIPGKMCISAATCYALGEPHGDSPPGVEPCVTQGENTLNDSAWSSNEARAKGLRRVAIAQLGSKGVVDPAKYAQRLSDLTIRNVVPIALRTTAKLIPDHQATLEDIAVRCELKGSGAHDVARAVDAIQAAVIADYNSAFSVSSASVGSAFSVSSASAVVTVVTRYATSSVGAACDAVDAACDATGAMADAIKYATEFESEYIADASKHAASAVRDVTRAARAAAAVNSCIAAAVAAKHTAGAASMAAATNTATDEVLTIAAGLMEQCLRECGSPGCEWLWLTEEAA